MKKLLLLSLVVLACSCQSTINGDGDLSPNLSRSVIQDSFPSMPIALYMPGTSIPASAVGRIPLYNKPLGVFNIQGRPALYLTHSIVKRNRHDDPYNPGETITEITEKLSCGQHQSFAQYLQINPEVEKIADVSVVKEELFALDKDDNFYTDTDFCV